MSLVSAAATIAHEVTRSLHGETVVLKNRAGSTLATITDAIVSIEPAVVPGIGEEMPDKQGVLRLQATHRANALAAFTATVRGIVFHVVHVSEVFGDLFRVEIGTKPDENSHTNMFDVSGKQIPWSGQ